MCGIAGYQTAVGANPVCDDNRILAALAKRGPDAQQVAHIGTTTLYHARLSIIDLSTAANQPMWDASGRYALIFNGEIFNYTALRQRLQQAGHSFTTQSDSEVLLQAFIRWGTACIQELEGFFAFAILDKASQTLWLVRDRYGMKPLYYYCGQGWLGFASEMKALLAMPVPRVLDRTAVAQYAQLNYVPPHRSIVQGVQQLAPGTWLRVHQGGVAEQGRYYSLPPKTAAEQNTDSYETAQRRVHQLLDESVQRKLVADVPLGVFLSGGIDSSIIAILAARHTQRLHTYSIGFQDSLYDETQYAELVAHKIRSSHTVFHLTHADIYSHYQQVLDYMDEPFADASALNFYILSKLTRQHVTVALSGDGADELFAGYMKHQGEYWMRNRPLMNGFIRLLQPAIAHLPAHRNSTLMRKLYQAKKYARALTASPTQRFIDWAAVLPSHEAANLLVADSTAAQADMIAGLDLQLQGSDLNEVLRADFALTLPGDMLTKADRMSMANSLEVRVPFLDHHLVDYVFALPSAFKINGHMRKRILQDTFRSELPPELYNRPKQGFEVPLRSWLVSEMQSYMQQHILQPDFVQHQGLFHYPSIVRLWDRVVAGSNNKEEHTLWALIVFQHCYKKYFA